jgi:tetratricopeptide (TPR) repeat protein
MNGILTCPHCGPTLTEARLRCDRCGRDLVYISEHEFTGGKALDADVEQQPAGKWRAILWVGVSTAAVAVVALAGLTIPGRQVSAPAQADTLMPATILPPVALSGSPSKPGAASAADSAAAFETVAKPGDLAEALARYRAALAEKPADPELLGNIGQILIAMNKPAEAVPFLEQAVEAESFSVVARFDLAVAYGRSGKLREALEQYEALARSGEADSRIHHNVGLLLRQLGRNTEAAAAFERATALAPDKAPGWLGLALSLEADGRAVEAAAALEHYLALEPSAENADNVRARIARLRAVADTSTPHTEAGEAAARRRP